MDMAAKKTDLHALLLNYKSATNFTTHVSMIAPYGSYLLDRQGTDKFYEKYCDIVANDSNIVLGIAEKPFNIIPVLVDVDIKFKEQDQNTPLYSQDQLKHIVKTYNTILSDIIENISDKDLECVVLEKEFYRVLQDGKSWIKNGFHLHYPRIFLSKEDHENALVPRIKEALKNDPIFQNLGIDDASRVIDTSYCRVPWLLYGSRKSESHAPYLFSKVYDKNIEEININDAFRDYKIYNYTDGNTIKIENNALKYLPRILSIDFASREVKSVKRGAYKTIANKKRKTFVEATDEKIKADVKEARDLVCLLGDFRAEDRNEWMNIGWILFSISKGSAEGLDLWMDFSSKDSVKFDEDTCIMEWGKMVASDYTLGTLKYYANIDNPTLYKELIYSRIQENMEAKINGEQYDIAKLLYEEYCLDFVCVNTKGTKWYQYVHPIWEETENNIELKKHISTDILKKFSTIALKIFKEQLENQDDETLKAKRKLLESICKKLKSNTFKNGVMSECVEFFYNKNFEEKLDTNPYLIAFKNGVYDLKNNVFRKGRPDDYLSKKMPINYTVFDPCDERYIEVVEFIRKLFPNNELRQYFLDTTSDIFVGDNKQKTVQFWTGVGNNGKSILQCLMGAMLGKLCVQFETTLVTGEKPKAGSANPELSRAGNGVRMGICSEPGVGEKINSGIIKSLSGNDPYFARDLYEAGKKVREIKPMFKLVFVCNKLLDMRGADRALWNRVRVIPFESTFIDIDKHPDEVPADYDEQFRQKIFPMDLYLMDKLPQMAEPFAWLLLEHRKTAKVRKDPAIVTNATRMYMLQNDIYTQYIEERIMEEPGCKILIRELYEDVKEWYKYSFPSNPLPLKNDVITYFSSHWKGGDKTGWKGYRLKTVDDELDDGSAVEIGIDELNLED